MACSSPSSSKSIEDEYIRIITVYVRIPNGCWLECDLTRGSTISELLNPICRLNGFDPKLHVLMLNDIELDKTKTLLEYDIDDEASLIVVSRFSNFGNCTPSRFAFLRSQLYRRLRVKETAVPKVKAERIPEKCHRDNNTPPLPKHEVMTVKSFPVKSTEDKIPRKKATNPQGNNGNRTTETTKSTAGEKKARIRVPPEKLEDLTAYYDASFMSYVKKNVGTEKIMTALRYLTIDEKGKLSFSSYRKGYRKILEMSRDALVTTNHEQAAGAVYGNICSTNADVEEDENAHLSENVPESSGSKLCLDIHNFADKSNTEDASHKDAAKCPKDDTPQKLHLPQLEQTENPCSGHSLSSEIPEKSSSNDTENSVMKDGKKAIFEGTSGSNNPTLLQQLENAQNLSQEQLEGNQKNLERSSINNTTNNPN